MPGDNKRSYVLKQTCSFWLQVSVSMYDLMLSPGIEGLNLLLMTDCYEDDRVLSFGCSITLGESS